MAYQKNLSNLLNGYLSYDVGHDQPVQEQPAIEPNTPVIKPDAPKETTDKDIGTLTLLYGRPMAEKMIASPDSAETVTAIAGGPPLTPKQIRAKYKDNPFVSEGRETWGASLDKSLTYSNGKIKDNITNAAKTTGIKPSLLYSSAMEEGLNLAIKDPDVVSEAYVSWSEKNPKDAEQYPVDGFYNYGLDTFGGRYKEYINKGYLPKDFAKKFKVFDATNEKNETVKTAAFASEEDALTAKSAMIRDTQDKLDAYLKKNNIKLTDKAKDFFVLAGYNAGEGNMRNMLQSYKAKGYLNNDDFLSPTFKPASYGGVYNNIQRRLQNKYVLENEGFL